LRKSLDLIRLLLDCPADAGVAVLAADLQVLDCNSRAEAFLANDSGHWRLTPKLRTVVESLREGALAERGSRRIGSIEVAGGLLHIGLRATVDSESGTGHALLLDLIAPQPNLRYDEELRWRTVAELAGTGVWDWDLDAGTVWLAPRWKAMLGYAPNELSRDQNEWYSRIHPDDLPGLSVALDRHFSGVEPVYEHEFRLRHRDGRWINYRGRGRLVARTPDGRPLRMIGTGEDVTAERKRAASLERQAWVLREAQRLARAGSWVWNVAEDRHEVSPQFCELFGVASTELTGPLANGRTLVTPESYERVLAARRRAAETGEGYQLEVDGIHRDGRRIVVRSYAEPQRGLDGKVAEVLGVAVDITAERDAERALRAQRDLLAAMARLGAIGGWELDPSSGTTRWTDEVYHLHELDPSVPTSLIDGLAFYPGEAGERLATMIARCIEGGEAFDAELPFRTAQGNSRWVRVNGSAEWVDGQCVRVYGAIQDITERKRLELSLIDARNSLLQRNRDLSAFASIAAHDLKEPARKVDSFLDLALATLVEVGDTERDFLQRARRASQRMVRLVDDLLALARTGSRPIDLTQVSLDALLDEVLVLFEDAIAASGARIVRRKLGTLEGDARLLGQLLQNLIGNAIKFTLPGRTPEIRIEPLDAGSGDSAGFCVHDNGIGFEPQYAEQIFEPFRRLHGRMVYDGSGIGLALVRRIVERHRGKVRAEGRPGQGACFEIDLPLRQPDTIVRTGWDEYELARASEATNVDERS
jgi:PAS domain S-box-containing protein